MRKIHVGWCGVLCVAAWAGIAVPASAQDVTLGYQYQRLHGNYSDSNFKTGLGGDVSVPISRHLAAVAAFDWSRRAEKGVFDDGTLEIWADLLTVAGGVRAQASSDSDQVFVEATAGALRYSAGCKTNGVACPKSVTDPLSNTDKMFSAGGGIAVHLAGHWMVVARADYRRLYILGHGGNATRVLGGVRYAFK
jgi:hypothetical protein